MLKVFKSIRIIYAVYPPLCVYFTLSAILYEKFGGTLLGVYSVLYGLVVIPQIALNSISKLLAIKCQMQHKRCVGDIVQPFISISVLCILIPISTAHDMHFIIPWVLVLVSNIIIRFYFKHKAL